MTSAPTGETEPQDGVIATSPETRPEAAPSEVAWPSRNRSTSSQPRVPVAPASRVAAKTTAARWSAARAEPALKPNHPNHSSPAPSITRVRLCGRIGSLPKPTRRPEDERQGQRRGAGVDLDRRAAGEVDEAEPVGHPAADVVAGGEVEDPVGDRRVDEQRPRRHEHHPGPEAGPVGDRPGDQRAGDDAEQALEHREQDERERRVRRCSPASSSWPSPAYCVGSPSRPSAEVVTEGDRVADERPERR